MSTRSLTRIYEYGETAPLVTIYRHCDGYPSGMGADLGEFCAGLRITNGISGDSTRTANGAECFAALLIGHLKGGEVGNVYLMPAKVRDAGQEYEYTVTISAEDRAPNQISITCYSVDMSYPGKDYTKPARITRKRLFEGNAVDFLAWAKVQS